jgi:hypothetical protein
MFKSDWAIMFANGASFVLLGIILCFKLRGLSKEAQSSRPSVSAQVGARH